MVFDGMDHRKYKLPDFAESRDSEKTYQPPSGFEEKSRIFPALKQSHNSFSQMLSRHQQPNNAKENRECKYTTLTCYDTNLDSVRSKTILSVPNLHKQVPRKTFMPGMSMGMIDPTGFGFIEESHRGLEGQHYGMASYKKGLRTVSMCNIKKA